jgi:tripeptidyl-peptidase-1
VSLVDIVYQMQANVPDTFIDITVGNNRCTEMTCQGCQGFECSKGWDPITGLGSPNYPAMLDYIMNKSH